MSSTQPPAFQSDEFVQRWLADSVLQRAIPEGHGQSPRDEQYHKTRPSRHAAAGVKDDVKRRSHPHDEHESFVTTIQPSSRGRVTHSKPIRPVNVRPISPIPPQHNYQDGKGIDVQSSQDCPDPSEKYARRQRNKTKDDRYELKESKPKPQAKGSQRSTIRQKPSATLEEDFHAPNVHARRLTLKPNLGPGMFAKGKASLPTQMQGVPDLTFSEMRFLSKQGDYNSKRQILHIENNVLKRAKSIPSEDISRFFSHAQENEASTNPKDLQFNQCTTDALEEKSWTKGMTSDPTTSANATTWSISPPRQSHCLREGQRQHPPIPASSLRMTRLQRRASHGSAPSAPRTPEIHPMSSASNCFLRQHTDHVLMSDVRDWSQQKKQYLSLDDLKRLAMKTARHETTLREDEAQEDNFLSNDISLDPSVRSQSDNPYVYHHGSTENKVEPYSRLSKGAELVHIGSDRGAAYHVSRAFSARSAALQKNQSGPFQQSLQFSHGNRHDGSPSEDFHSDIPIVNASTSTPRLIVPLNEGSPVLKSTDMGLYSRKHDNCVDDGYVDKGRSDATCLFTLERDLESLDQFDIELLGMDDCRDTVSTRMVDYSESAVLDANPVEELALGHHASATLGDANVDYTRLDLGHTESRSRHLEEDPLRCPPNCGPVSQQRGNAFGLISRALEEPDEEVFTGLSRPHILY